MSQHLEIWSNNEINIYPRTYKSVSGHRFLCPDIDFYVTPTGFLGSREVVVRIPRSMSLSLDIDLPKGQDKKKIKMR